MTICLRLIPTPTAYWSSRRDADNKERIQGFTDDRLQAFEFAKVIVIRLVPGNELDVIPFNRMADQLQGPKTRVASPFDRRHAIRARDQRLFSNRLHLQLILT